MNLTNISKYIALVLRHKPEIIGIELDEHGWADVGKLVAGIKKEYPEFSLGILKEIVVSDNKQRYAFSEDEKRIRARQGHSVNVNVELKEVVPPDTLYHGTATRFLDSILFEGLVPKSRLYVHLSKDCDTAVKVGERHGIPVVLKIDAKRMHKDGYTFSISENGVYLTKFVPVKYISGTNIKENLS